MKLLVGLTPQRTALTLSFDYNPAIITRLKNRVYGRAYDGDLKCWVLPLASFDDLVQEFGAMIELTVPFKEIVEAIDSIAPVVGTVDMQAAQVLKLKPYDYQIIGGAAFLPNIKCGILADVPGLGKCLTPDSRIYMNGANTTLQQIWDSYVRELSFDGEGYWSSPSKDLYVPSLDNGKLIYSKVKRIYRQWIDAPIKVIKLTNGSVLRATLTEKLFDGYSWSNNLQPGDCVAIPNVLPDFKHNINAQSQIVKLIAWQLAEGHEASHGHSFRIYQDNIDVLNHIASLLSYLNIQFDIKHEPGKCPYIRGRSKEYHNIMTSYDYAWGAKSKDKRIPSFIFNLPDKLLRTFLSVFFDAESNVNVSTSNMEITSASSEIIFGIKQLLLRFGIKMNTAEYMKCATNGTRIKRKYYRGYVSGEDLVRFYHTIGYCYEYKMSALSKVANKKHNSNIYVYPIKKAFENFTDSVKIPPRYFKYRKDYLTTNKLPSIDGLRKMSKGFDYVLSGEAESDYKKLKPSKWTVKTLESFKNADYLQIANVKDKINHFLHSDVAYVRIDSISYEQYSGWVYDLEIENTHNFIAEGMCVHNTIQTFLGFASLCERGLAQKCLVFCKANLKSQWLSELEKFTSYKGIKIKGTPEQRLALYEEAAKPEYQFIFVNYEFLIHDKKYVKECERKTKENEKLKAAGKKTKRAAKGFDDFENLEYLMRQCQVLVMDEAQKVKNDSSQIHKNLFKMVYGTKTYPSIPPEYRWLLTGTPIENEPEDIYNLFKFVNQSVLGHNPNTFKYRYYEGRYHEKVRKDMLKDLSMRIAPYMLRRTQENVKRAFPKVRIDEMLLDMTNDQIILHDILKEITRDLIDGVKHPEIGNDDYSPIGIFSLLLRVADNPDLLFTSESDLARSLAKKHLKTPGHECPKIEWICDYLEARKQFEPDAKTIIFTRSDDMAHLTRESLLQGTYKDNDIILFVGGMSEKQRDTAKARFWKDGKIFISTDAGSEGLNLQCANVEINIDLPPTPSRLAQRIGRIKRDQSEFSHVRIINLISKDSIDERILKIIYDKQSIIDSVIEGNIADINLTQSVLLELLS